jgi:hypothetical protein
MPDADAAVGQHGIRRRRDDDGEAENGYVCDYEWRGSSVRIVLI